MNPVRELHLNSLKQGLPGVSKTRGSDHSEACLVCLESHRHATGKNIEVKGSYHNVFHLWWDDPITDQIRRSWKDKDDATESGACGIAFLLILELTEYTIIERSRKGTGFDYYLGFKDTLIFQNAARLEVSGMFQALSENNIVARVNQKLRQTNRSDNSRLPAFVVVVEFSKPVSYVMKK